MGDCNYLYGNYSARKRIRFLGQLLSFYGLDERRMRTAWVSSAEASEFASEIRDFITVLKELGPSPMKTSRIEAAA
ncbi:MAG: hydrogenase iron-sulfur subunit [Desulfohalobiaceae bacterium]|nr:hydrogenase iron-sulfur subunit [Desulfohalobiaceae bacterium]